MDSISNLALGSGLSWVIDLQLYATVFFMGILTKFGYIHSPETLAILSKPMLIVLSGVLSTIEFLADKIPYIGSAWDGMQTFIRIPAGALLVMGDINTSDHMMATIAALLGGSLTAMTYATKAESRAVINSSPEPVTKIAASFGEEDGLVTGVWLVFAHPAVLISLVCGFIVLIYWLLPKLWHNIKNVLEHIGRISWPSTQ